MIPQGGALEQRTQVEQQPSRTYRLDLNKKRVVGVVDGLEAIKQAVFKILQTERFDYLIYSTAYGVELNHLEGSNRAFVRSELSRRIREALLQDDRITDIQTMQISFEGDTALAEFVVISQYGEFRNSLEVTSRV